MHETKKLLSCVLALAACAPACKSRSASKADKGVAQAESAKKAEHAGLDGLKASADLVLDALEALETERDVTCWTSFRQLDWFIAEKTYSELATLSKVTAIKALTRAVWGEASATAGTGKITAADIQKAVTLPEVAVPDAVQGGFSDFANDIGLKNYTDYQKTAEHWRIVLAVIQDEMVQTGGQPTLRPLDASGLEALADAATTLSLMLLKGSGEAAEAASSTIVDGAHVHSAYNSIATAHGLESEPRQREPLPPELVKRYAQPLTARLIEGKAKALIGFNQARLAQEMAKIGGKAGEAALKDLNATLTTDLNRVARMPLTPEAVHAMRLQLQSFVHFVAKGYEPMRADNYLDDGSYAATEMPTHSYVDELTAQNVVMQLFPHRMLANGDVLVRYEPNPGPVTGLDLEPIEIRILDHEMNGVRDSAVHWISTGIVWDEAPFAMDPFAAEYLTEVVSMMMASWMRRAELIAQDQGKTEIDAAVAKQVRTRSHVMVQPPDPERVSFGDAEKAKKAKLLAGYKGPLFRDVSAGAGLATELARFGTSLTDAVGSEPAAPSTDAVAFDLQTIMGGGIAVGDLNADGYPDLYISGEELGRLYLNRGKAAPGKFVDATAAWGLPEDIDDGHGTLFYDAEGDGDLDLLILRSQHPSLVMLQDGGKFTDAAKTLGFTTARGAHVAHVFDYDRDGDLDLYIGYYGSHEANKSGGKVRSVPSLDGRNGSENQLWRNDGKTWTEVAGKAGVADIGWTLALGSFDADGDGDLDLYLANDFGANRMFTNNGDGTFGDITDASGTGDRGSGMNVDVADLNGDGKWDIYVTNIDMFSKNIKVVFPRDESTIDIGESLTRAFQYLSGNKLYMSGEDGYVSEEELRFEPKDRGWGWDAGFFDYENDGDADLYLTNGWISGSYAGNQKNQMYLNDEGFFYLAKPDSPEAFAGNTRSAAAVDIDGDGDLDIVTSQFRQPPRVLENTQNKKHQWIKVRLKGNGKNPYALGARVIVHAGERKLSQQVSGGRGYVSQADSVLTFGTGDDKLAEVSVVWPDGSESKATGLATGKLHLIEQPGS